MERKHADVNILAFQRLVWPRLSVCPRSLEKMNARNVFANVRHLNARQIVTMALIRLMYLVVRSACAVLNLAVQTPVNTAAKLLVVMVVKNVYAVPGLNVPQDVFMVRQNLIKMAVRNASVAQNRNVRMVVKVALK